MDSEGRVLGEVNSLRNAASERKLFRSVAFLARRRNRFIENYGLSGNYSRQLMAVETRHIFVGAVKRIPGPFIVVKLSRFPAHGVMTTGTVGGVRPRSKLIGVRIFMTAGAEFRCGRKIHILQSNFQGRRTVTVNARDATVRAGERKFRGRMIEVSQFVPLHSRVTRFTSGGRAVRPFDLHRRTKFSPMRIVMADRAVAIVESVLHRNQRTFRHSFVAIATGNGNVRAGQRETRVFVPGQGKQGRTKTFVFQVMANLAAAERRRSGKLAFVNVLVAIFALRRRIHKFRVLAFGALWHMAFLAVDGNVDPLQGIPGGGMFLHAESGRLPTGFVVAGGAFAVIRTGAELSMMRVLVTIHALGVCHGRFKIAFRVAIAAGNCLVLAKQRKFSFGVVKTLQLCDASPTRSVVASLARRGKCALVWIGVASGAFRERKSGIFYVGFGALNYRMAFRAIQFFMRTGERIF